jgi:hypothetical protein
MVLPLLELQKELFGAFEAREEDQEKDEEKQLGQADQTQNPEGQLHG